MAFWNRNKILSDKELAEGIVRGDEVCYERFFEKYYVVVRKFIMSLSATGQLLRIWLRTCS